MKIVFQCEFCGEVSKIESDMQVHEEMCIFNPDKNLCYSCVNYDSNTGPFGDDPICKAGGDIQETEDEEIPCALWKRMDK